MIVVYDDVCQIFKKVSQQSFKQDTVKFKCYVRSKPQNGLWWKIYMIRATIGQCRAQAKFDIDSQK